MKQNTKDFAIISYLPRGSGVTAFQPASIKRLHDGEIFHIGDTVTNGTKMIGEILSFEMLNGHVFVNHTWSGVGMNLGSLKKVIQLPSSYQIQEVVKFNFTPEIPGNGNTATIIGVHFYPGKAKYDLAVWVGEGGNETTRIYNIDSCFIFQT